MPDGFLFIAPLPPRGWRRVRAAVVDRWRGWRFRRSTRWQPLGLYTPEEHRRG